jgi:hypothetical protein
MRTIAADLILPIQKSPFYIPSSINAYQASLVTLQRNTFGDFTPITVKGAKWDIHRKTIKTDQSLQCNHSVAVCIAVYGIRSVSSPWIPSGTAIGYGG